MQSRLDREAVRAPRQTGYPSLVVGLLVFGSLAAMAFFSFTPFFSAVSMWMHYATSTAPIDPADPDELTQAQTESLAEARRLASALGLIDHGTWAYPNQLRPSIVLCLLDEDHEIAARLRLDPSPEGDDVARWFVTSWTTSGRSLETHNSNSAPIERIQEGRKSRQRAGAPLEELLIEHRADWPDFVASDATEKLSRRPYASFAEQESREAMDYQVEQGRWRHDPETNTYYPTLRGAFQMVYALWWYELTKA